MKLKRINKYLLSLGLTLPSFAKATILDNLTGKNEDLGAIATLITNVSAIVTGTAAAIAVLMIIVGGFIYITSAGNAEKAEQGKKYLTYAVIGLIMVILAKVILRFFAQLLGGDFS